MRSATRLVRAEPEEPKRIKPLKRACKPKRRIVTKLKRAARHTSVPRPFIVHPATERYPLFLDELKDDRRYAIFRALPAVGSKVFVVDGYRLKGQWNDLHWMRETGLSHKARDRHEPVWRANRHLLVKLPDATYAVAQRLHPKHGKAGTEALNNQIGW